MIIVRFSQVVLQRLSWDSVWSVDPGDTPVNALSWRPDGKGNKILECEVVMCVMIVTSSMLEFGQLALLIVFLFCNGDNCQMFLLSNIAAIALIEFLLEILSNTQLHIPEATELLALNYMYIHVHVCIRIFSHCLNIKQLPVLIIIANYNNTHLHYGIAGMHLAAHA